MFHTFTGDAHTSWYRFIVLAVFCVFSCSNAMQWLTYGAVPTQIKAFYGINTTQLNMLSTIYMIVYIAFGIGSCLGLERIGLRWCMLFGTGLNFLGAILKLVIGFPSDTYAAIFVSQFINSCAQIFVLSVPPSLALVWFKESERGSATAVGSAANALGSALGMLIPPLWVKDGVDLSQGLNKLFGFQLALCGVAFIGTLFLVPATKKSAEEEEKEQKAKGSEGQTRIVEMAVVDENTREDRGPIPTSVSAMASPMSPFDINADEECRRALLPPAPAPHPTAPAHEEIFSPNEVVDDQPITTAKIMDLTSMSPPSPTGLSSVNNHLVDEASGRGAGNSMMSPSVAPLIVSDSRAAAPATPDTVADAPDPESWAEVFKGLWKLICDRDSLLCELGLSISIGSVWAVNTLLAQLLASVNISEKDAGQIGFWNVIVGTIMAVLSGWFIDKFRVYKWPIFGLAFFSLAFLSFIIMLFYIDGTELGDPVESRTRNGIYALNVLAGIPQNVITPIGFEFLMELTYGQPESISGGLLMALANTVSLMEVQIGSAFLGDATIAPKSNSLNAFWLVWAFLAVGLVLLATPRNNLKRLAAQRKEAEEAAAAAATSATLAIASP